MFCSPFPSCYSFHHAVITWAMASCLIEVSSPRLFVNREMWYTTQAEGLQPWRAQSSSSICWQWNQDGAINLTFPALGLLEVIIGNALYSAAVLNSAPSFTWKLKNYTVSTISSTAASHPHSVYRWVLSHFFCLYYFPCSPVVSTKRKLEVLTVKTWWISRCTNQK